MLDQITALAEAIDEPGDRFHAAEALYGAKQFSRAADMYDGLYTPDKDSVPLRHALRALLFSERRREARALFERISEPLRQLPDYAELGVAIYEQSGLLKQARTTLEMALAKNDTLKFRLHWISLCERLGDTEAAIAWLSKVPAYQTGSPNDLMALALAIDRIQSDPKCYPIAYRALRTGYSNPQVHLGYMLGLTFLGSTSRHAFKEPAEIGPDTAVLLEEKGGERKLVRILETEADPKIERGEIAPTDELWPQLLGLKVGNEIEVPTIGPEPIIFVVREIRDKYLHAHFRSLEEFEKLFPGHRGFGSFKIDERKGEQGFKPLFDSVKRRGEYILKLMGLYRNGQVPLMLMAKLAGASPLDTWDALAEQQDPGLRSCTGPPQEFAQAESLLQEKRNAIVDPITLYALSRMGISSKIRGCFDDVATVQTTIDLLRRLYHERTQARGTRRGTMGWDGQHYRMVELDDGLITQQIEDARRALDFAESLTLVPAEAGEGQHVKSREIFEDAEPAFLDTLLAAQGNERLLLCDDSIFRQLALEVADVQGVWSQPAGLFALRHGAISDDDYNAIVSGLVGAGYRFTPLNYHNVLYQLSRDGWRITQGVEAFACNLAIPTNEIGSVTRVLADLMHHGWPSADDRKTYITFFVAVFRAFRRSQPQLDLAKLASHALAIVRSRFRANGHRNLLLQRLRESTTITPAGPIVAQTDADADRIFGRLVSAIDEALAHPSVAAVAPSVK